MTVHSSGETIDAVLAQLRAEEPLEQEPAQQAILRHEAAFLEETQGDEDAAVRDYLAALDSDPELREPLEALVRVLGRKGDQRLGRLLEALVDLAHNPAAAARALCELALHRADVEDDLAGARVFLEQAVEQSPEDAASWLELELVAAKEGDLEGQRRALEARTGLTTNPTWQGLILTELAELVAASGDKEQASRLLDTVAGLEGRARFFSRLVLERIAREMGDAELQAHALDGQAELIVQAIDDPDLGARMGVPSLLCEPRYAADAHLRAGELRRRNGDAWGAVAALRAAAERLRDDALVARLSMAAADAAGDTDAAVQIAREQLEAGATGPAAGAMWLRIAGAAEIEGDFEAALEAYTKALELDPGNLVALSLRTDLLAQGDDAAALAEALEKQAEHAGSDEARARTLIVVAYVWSVRAGDVARGREVLKRSAALGTPEERLLHVARSFASLGGDAAWYEETTERLYERAETNEERASLAFELGRLRLVRGDDAGALEAFTKLSGADGEPPAGPNAWLGLALRAYALGLGHPEKRDPAAVASLAEVESEPQLGRGLALVAALAMLRGGQKDEGLSLLAREHDRDPADPIVGACLADARRASGDVAGATLTLQTCSGAAADPQVGGALALEAGLLSWRAGDRDAAIEAFEGALELVPEAAQLMLTWALRAARPDDLQTRLRAIDLAEELETDGVPAALERFGVGLSASQGEADPVSALERLEELDPGGDIALAAAVGRLLLGSGDAEALRPVLQRLEELGGSASQVARAEAYRMARFVERDAQGSIQTAAAWHQAAPSQASALEWLASSFAADDRLEEIRAREALGKTLRGDAAVSVAASTAAVRMVVRPGRSQPLITSDQPAARLMNLELALPGADPYRRARALEGLGDALGDEAAHDARRMAAWNELAAAAYGNARDLFRVLVEEEPDDIASWEGFRAASGMLGDYTSLGVALARLGNLCQNPTKAAELWEEAGLTLLEHTQAHDDAEIALQRAIDNDKTRFAAFDKLFRRVRARKDNDRLLKLIDLRLEVTNDETEITKMYWERARVYRERGDNERALKCLKDVTMLEPDHVGALALAGEISIKKGDFGEAAPLLGRLAGLGQAPKKQRLLSGIAAVDLYEKKLNEPRKSLEVLLQLYRDGLSTIKVRERLARTAARVGNWEEAVKILERLMEERDSSKGRSEAARLAMAIYRDKLREPRRATEAVRKLLEEEPDDREAIALLLREDVSEELRSVALPMAKRVLLGRLMEEPFDLPRVELLADIAEDQDELNLRRAALGVAIALGNDTEAAQRSAAEVDARSVLEPQIILDDRAVALVGDPDDNGPIAELFVKIAPVVAEALGPSTKSEDVGRRQRVDSGAVRTEVSRWMGAIGIEDFDVYVGGKEPNRVKGIAEDKPALVLGEKIRTPLDTGGRMAVAREVYGLRRGSTAVMHLDDASIASIVVAVCKDAGVHLADPPFAVFREIERLIKKAMSRRIRKTVTPICERVAQSGHNATTWAAAARRSIDRMSLIACGDASSVIEQIVGPPGSPARLAMEEDVRARRLLAFALSSEYLGLRQKLGMGAA